MVEKEEDKGVLALYIENDLYMVERITPFNHSFKNTYQTEKAFYEAIESYKPIINQMDLRLQKDIKMQDGTSLLKRAMLLLFDK